MLRRSDSPVPRPRGGPDPVARLTVGLLVGVAVGLLIAGILAVYDYTTPSIEAPLVTAVAALFVATVAFNVGAAAARGLGSRR